MKWLTKQDLSERCQVSLRTVSNWMAAGWISYVKLGRVVRFDPVRVFAELEARKIPSR